MLTKENKMEIAKMAISYACGGCLSCLSGGEQERLGDDRTLFFLGEQRKISDRLQIIGVSLTDLNAAFAKTGVSYSRGWSDCISTDRFLEIIEQLIDEQM